jgi:uncharacterized protein
VFPGFGTLVNVATVLVGASIGVVLGHRLLQRTRDLVTDALGLVTLLIAALSATAVLDPALRDHVADGAPILIVLGSLLVGGIAGSLLRLEERIEAIGGWLQHKLAAGADADRARFVEGFVVSSLVFCSGPLTILGSLNEGLGNGSEQLLLKAVLDGFAALAFAASFGWGVAASAITVIVIQGTLTLLGLAVGGGLLLVGVALRLLRIREIPVADLLPALIVAPTLTAVVASLHG